MCTLCSLLFLTTNGSKFEVHILTTLLVFEGVFSDNCMDSGPSNAQAMEMMKVTTSSSFLSNNSGYQSYFEAFLENKLDNSIKDTGIGEGVLNQSLPYIIFLLSPILLVLLAAVQKRI